MGHMSSKDAYRKLGDKIDNLSARTPWSETLHEILKELYSAEEADVVVKMPFGLSSLKKIARTTKYDESKLRTILEGLADKGLVVDLHRGEKAYYLPSPMVIGIFEFTMMRTDANLDRKKMSGLFHEYLKGDNRFYAANGVDHQLVSVLRTLPYQESVVPDQHVEVLDFEKAEEIIQGHARFSVGICSCRHEMEHLGGRKCTTPLETCVSFGSSVDYLVRHGFAREATKQEILDLLARSKAEGLVLSADNVKKNTQYMCHCCGCCCNYLAGLRDWGLPNVVVTSTFEAQVKDGLCNGCGLCEKTCPVGAIKVEGGLHGVNKLGKLARVRAGHCIGCGVCATKCKPKSVQLHLRARRVITPEDTFEKTILQSLQRGTLQNLVFDNPMDVGHAFMRAFVGGFLRLNPVKRALMSDTFRSRFLHTMRKGVQSQGQGWMAKM